MATTNSSLWRFKSVLVIWVICIFLFYAAFRMALRNSSIYDSASFSDSSGASITNGQKRLTLYDSMARDLDEHGAAFLKRGLTSQSLSLSDLFALKDDHVVPNLKAANPPVRANILYLSTKYSSPMANAAKDVFYPYFNKAIWFQNPSLYHFSMFHASHHIAPVHATEDEVKNEVNAVRAVVETLSPLKIVLDRVVLTSNGVLLGCWQVVSGTDPVEIRAKLRRALPHAPEKQLYDPAILHTSFARLLGPPTIPFEELHKSSNEILLFHNLVSRLNDKIRGFEAVVSELWYVVELDILALALDGRMKVRKFSFDGTKP